MSVGQVVFDIMTWNLNVKTDDVRLSKNDIKTDWWKKMDIKKLIKTDILIKFWNE